MVSEGSMHPSAKQGRRDKAGAPLPPEKDPEVLSGCYVGQL